MLTRQQQEERREEGRGAFCAQVHGNEGGGGTLEPCCAPTSARRCSSLITRRRRPSLPDAVGAGSGHGRGVPCGADADVVLWLLAGCMAALRMSRECKVVPGYYFLIGRLTVNPGPAGA